VRSAPLHLRHATPAHADSSEFYPLLADAHEACERRRTERRRARVLHPARPRSLAGVFGYLLAAERTSGDILTQLPNKPAGQADFGPQDVPCPEHTWACPYDVDVARACIAITVSASYPMLQFVSRACLDDLLVSHGLVAPRTGPGGPLPLHRLLLESIFYVVVTTLIAMVEPDVAAVMDYIGSSLALLQVFIFPALLLWKLDQLPQRCATIATLSGSLADEPPRPSTINSPPPPPRSMTTREMWVPPGSERRLCRFHVHACGERVPTLSVVYLLVAIFICVAYYSTLFMS